MNKELKKELDKTLVTLAKRVDSCRESLMKNDTKMYKHYVNDYKVRVG